GCSLPSYIASNVNNDINFALGIWLHAQQKLGTKDVPQQLSYFYQARSIEMNCLELASLGATIANHGTSVGPSSQQVFSPDAARETIQLVRSCGMAAASRSWSSSKGIPCKSSISGGVLILIPSVAAIAVYSPLLDSQLNSVRGFQFVSALVEKFGPL
ncbi:MAG: glutaminase, partial [archaeon]|nr:glutaminase [archaeon]